MNQLKTIDYINMQCHSKSDLQVSESSRYFAVVFLLDFHIHINWYGSKSSAGSLREDSTM